MARKPINFSKSKKARKPLWNPLAGITQTGLEKFMTCPEQFAVSYVEGATPKKFREPLEFGSLFHLCCEFKGKDEPEIIAKKCCDAYLKSRGLKDDATEYRKLQQMVGVIRTIFPAYCKIHEKQDRTIKWIAKEKVFRIPYKFQDFNGKTQTIDLVGKMDGVYRNSAAKIGLNEIKTKSEINAEAIRDGLRADFQCLFYLLALRTIYEREPAEVLYDVVRRPGTYWRKTDTLKTYLTRVESEIKKHPKKHFARWRVTLSPGTIDTFCKSTLDPALRRLWQWWGSIADRPFDRWASPFHSLNLPALTNSKYGRSEYYELIVRGNHSHYYNRSILYPELHESIEIAA